eukprot:5367980-Prymnesium_polylepis.3
MKTHARKTTVWRRQRTKSLPSAAWRAGTGVALSPVNGRCVSSDAQRATRLVACAPAPVRGGRQTRTRRGTSCAARRSPGDRRAARAMRRSESDHSAARLHGQPLHRSPLRVGVRRSQCSAPPAPAGRLYSLPGLPARDTGHRGTRRAILATLRWPWPRQRVPVAAPPSHSQCCEQRARVPVR